MAVGSTQITPTQAASPTHQHIIFLSAHHDEIAGTFLDIGTEPMFMATRDTMPNTKAVSPLYREPVCINISPNLREEVREDVNALKTDLRGLNLRDMLKLFR
jgi:hypothetical protein